MMLKRKFRLVFFFSLLLHGLDYKKGRYVPMNNYFNSIDWSSLFYGSTVEQCYDAFLNHYAIACSQYIPLKPQGKYKTKIPWLSIELKKQIKLKNSLWQSYRQTNKSNNSLLESYKIAKRNVESGLREAKRKFEERLVINSKSNPKLLYSYIKKKQGVKEYIRCLRNQQGEITSNTAEIVNILNEQFQSVFVKNEDDNIKELETKTVNMCSEPKFVIDHVKNKILALKPFKSVGVDMVHGYVLRECVESLARPLSLIFQQSYNDGVVPAIWKKANITPLFKKGGKLEPANYRPVSLTSIVCKLMESLLKDTMVEHLEANQLINVNQHGFVRGKSCVSNLLETIDELTYNLWHRNSIDVVFLDFAKAFDTVPHKRLLAKLKTYGLSDRLVKWIEAFLTKRQQRVIMGSHSSFWAWVLSGVPQGSVLGPILFIIYINDLCDVIQSSTKLYADDSKVIANVNNEQDKEILQEDLDNIMKWSNEWLIKLNIDKCKIMHFGTSNHRYTYVLTEDQETFNHLSVTECEKDLGIMIRSDLKWKEQINYACSKANRAIGMLKRTFTYLNEQMVKQLFKTFVRPHLEYAVSVWCPYLLGDIQEIEKVQHRMTRLLPQLRSLCYEDRLKRLNLTTLETRRNRGDAIQMYKILQETDSIKFINRDVMYVSRDYMSMRSHKKQLRSELVKNYPPRFNYYVNRVARGAWNGLSYETVNAPNLNSFKNLIDKDARFLI
jgi:hypothetical protein